MPVSLAVIVVLGLFVTAGTATGDELSPPDLIEVTSLADGGPGSLREALQGGSRRITFALGGEIELRSRLDVIADDVTVDGGSAPAPGITISGKPFVIADVKNVVIEQLRFRDSDDDNVRIVGACRNIVIDHCSSSGAVDGAIDITLDYTTLAEPSDVTISWCLLSGTEKAMLVQSASDISLHHNLFVGNGQRSPQLHAVRSFDVRNNVIWHWGAYGCRIRAGSSGNLVNNLFGPSSNPNKRPDAALIVVRDDGDSAGLVSLFADGNSGPMEFDPDTLGNISEQFPAPDIEPTPTDEVLQTLLNEAGARPLDAIDTQFVSGVERID